MATVALFLLGVRQFVHSGVTTGVAMALLLCPVTILVLRRYRGARAFAVLSVIALLWGLLLSELARPGHVVSASLRTSSTVDLLGILAGVAMILWARQALSVSQVGVRYGLGMLAGGVLLRSQGLDNPWKHTWGIPIAVLVLALVGRRGRPYATAISLLALAAVSAASDSRSYAATFALAAMLVIWQLRPTVLSRRESWAWTTATMGALAAAVYYLGTTLLVDGYLGKDAQARSIQQIRTSGSLILGGRPELSATIALMRDHLSGFGVGVLATPRDILVAKTGLTSINYNPNNGYVEKFLFGTGIELHSNFGDLWANWGVPGLGLAVLIALIVIYGLADMVAHRGGDGLTVFLSCWALWNLLFSPLYGSVPTLTLTIGLVLRLSRAPSTSPPMPELGTGARSGPRTSDRAEEAVFASIQP